MLESIVQSAQSTSVFPGGLGHFTLLLLHLSGAALLGTGISLIYFITHKTKTGGVSFLLTLPLLSVITGFVISVIGNDLIRAFGLIGAISMVRFRTRVECTLDMAYIFMAIGIGLACGVGLHAAAVAGLLIFGITVVTGSGIINKYKAKRRRLIASAVDSENKPEKNMLTSPNPPDTRPERKTKAPEK